MFRHLHASPLRLLRHKAVYFEVYPANAHGHGDCCTSGMALPQHVGWAVSAESEASADKLYASLMR